MLLQVDDKINDLRRVLFALLRHRIALFSNVYIRWVWNRAYLRSVNLSRNSAKFYGTDFSSDFDVEAFLSRHEKLSPDSVWKKGEKRTLRGTHTESGFNVEIVEAHASKEAIEETLRVLNPLEKLIEELKSHGVVSVVDFGLFVGTKRGFTSSLYFTSSELAILKSLGVDLVISAYPCSDEDEEE